MVRTIIKTRICCVRVWFMGRHIYSYSLGNFPRINISYLVSNMITGSVNNGSPGIRIAGRELFELTTWALTTTGIVHLKRCEAHLLLE